MLSGRLASLRALSRVSSLITSSASGPPSSGRCSLWEAMRIFTHSIELLNIEQIAGSSASSRPAAFCQHQLAHSYSTRTRTALRSTPQAQERVVQRRVKSAPPDVGDKPAVQPAALLPDLQVSIRAVKTDDEHPCGEGKLEWPFNAKAFYVGECQILCKASGAQSCHIQCTLQDIAFQTGRFIWCPCHVAGKEIKHRVRELLDSAKDLGFPRALSKENPLLCLSPMASLSEKAVGATVRPFFWHSKERVLPVDSSA